MEWIRESDALPLIAQDVLLAQPAGYDKFWKIHVARILVRHEGVCPMPVNIGDDMPSEFWWARGEGRESSLLLSGKNWWASLTGLKLPPGAIHELIHDYDCIVKSE